jgi:serine-type D-Ala-D-Ala carboxypeptidase/endopeptidase (penicillin-binding protein 4)
MSIKSIIAAALFLTQALCNANTNSIAENTLPDSVAKLLASKNISADNLSVSIEEVSSANKHKSILAFNEHKSRNPASTIKILTTIIALDLLGKNYHWKTNVYNKPSNANIGAKNILNGDLYIELQGDPKLIPETIQPMLQKWKDSGITNINLDSIILNKQILSNNPDDASDEDNEVKSYAVDPHAATFAFKTLSITAYNKDLELSPTIYGLKFNNYINYTANICAAGKAWANNIVPKFNPDDISLSLNGAYSSNCSAKNLNIPVNMDDGEFLVRGILGEWQKMGGKVDKMPNISYANSINKVAFKAIGEIQSLPLQDIIKDINKFSNNLMARLTFLRLGITKQSNNLNAELSRKVAFEYLSKNNIDSTGIIMPNGSGLSTNGRISTYKLNQLLLTAKNKIIFNEFMQSLPIVGVDGTMKSRLKDISGQAFIKTGTLNSTKAIAGYVVKKDSGLIAITAIINDAKASQSTEILDALIKWTAQQP